MSKGIQRFLRVFVPSAALILVVLLWVSEVAYAKTYTHGYLHYEVADQSVTITGYGGREGTVTVPAMIGGNPVNTIATGAFADASTVSTVYLPDTVTSVEQGAFDVGQAVVFGWRADASAGDETAEGSQSDGGGETPIDGSQADADDTAVGTGETPSGGEASPSSGAPLGVRTPDGSLVTVDDKGILVLVDPSGTERVLDDSRSYTRKTQSDGTASIVNDAGEEVVVADGSNVSFSDAEGRRVVVDAARKTTTVTSEDGSYGFEEIDVEDEDGLAASSEQASSASSDKGTDEQKGPKGGILAPAVGALAAFAAVTGFVLWKRKK